MAVNNANLTRERAFRDAQSHSKRVRWLKRILPICSVGIVCVLGATLLISRPSSSVTFDLPSTTLVDGKLVMANPNLDGFTNDGRPFAVTAVRAIQDLAVQDELELDELAANVELKNGQSAQLTSQTGIFNSNSNLLVLPSNAFLTTSDGMRATMGQADINIQSGSVSATNSVKIVNTESVITAEAMQIEDGGRRIFFEHNVRLVLQPETSNKAIREAQISRTDDNARDEGIN